MKIKLLSLSFALIFMTSYAHAQISLEKTDTIVTPVTEEFDIPTHNSFTNNLPQQKTLRWIINEVDITDGWATYICDANACYPPAVDSAEVDLGPNASSILDLHLRTNDIYEGYAFVEVKLVHANDPNVNATVYYIFDSELPTSINQIEPLALNIYPNPSQGLFYLSDEQEKLSSIKVFSMAGQELEHINMGQKDWINLTKLKSGMYLIQLLDKDGINLASKLITKM